MTELDILRLAQDFLWDGVWVECALGGMPDDRTPAICLAIDRVPFSVGGLQDLTYGQFLGAKISLRDNISKRLVSCAFYTTWLSYLPNVPAKYEHHNTKHRQAARWVWLQLLIREAEQNGGYLAPDGEPSIDWAMWRQRVKDVETKVQQGEQS